MSLETNRAISLEDLSLEGQALLNLEGRDDGAYVYVVLTDTKTWFSRISQMITKDPYNHVSVMFADDADHIYTFALVNENGTKGGFKKEDVDILKNAHFSLYRALVTEEIEERIKDRVKYYRENVERTRYSHLGLFNALFQKEIFDSSEDTKLICSQFVVMLFEEVGVQLFKDGRSASTVRPYELVKSKVLEFVRRGKVKNKRSLQDNKQPRMEHHAGVAPQSMQW